MGELRRIGKSGHEDPVVTGIKPEVCVPEVTRWEWRCPQTVARPEVEEAERWDGLS